MYSFVYYLKLFPISNFNYMAFIFSQYFHINIIYSRFMILFYFFYFSIMIYAHHIIVFVIVILYGINTFNFLEMLMTEKPSVESVVYLQLYIGAKC